VSHVKGNNIFLDRFCGNLYHLGEFFKDRLDMLFCFFSRDEEIAHPISCFKMTFFWTRFLRKLKRLRPSTAQNIEFYGLP
jgi:hypothetical protein